MKTKVFLPDIFVYNYNELVNNWSNAMKRMSTHKHCLCENRYLRHRRFSSVIHR